MSNKNYDTKLQKYYEKIIEDMENVHQKQMKEKLIEERKKVLNDVIQLKPELVKDKDDLYTKLVDKDTNKTEKNALQNDPIVLEQIDINDLNNFKDKMGCIWNDLAEPVGIVDKTIPTNDKYILFNDSIVNDDNDFIVPKLK